MTRGAVCYQQTSEPLRGYTTRLSTPPPMSQCIDSVTSIIDVTKSFERGLELHLLISVAERVSGHKANERGSVRPQRQHIQVYAKRNWDS